MTQSTFSGEDQPVSIPSPLEALDEFCDLVSDEASPEDMGAVALKFLLDETDRQAGALVLQTATDRFPYAIVVHNLPEEWVGAIEDANSHLRCLVKMAFDEGKIVSDESIHLAIALPIKNRSGIQGVLLVHGPSYSQREIEFYHSLIHPLGRSLNSSRVNAKIKKRAKDVIALQMVVTTLGFNSEIEEMQVRMIQGLCQVLEAEMGALILVDEDQGDLVTKKCLDIDSNWLYQVNVKVGEGLINECLRTGAVIRLDDPSNDPRFNPEFDSVEGLRVRSLLIAPLMVNGHSLGAVQILNRRGGQFDESDQDLLVMIADLSAHGIYGTRLIEQLRVANADLEASHWELLRSRNTLRALFDSMPAALYIIDHKYKLVAINMSCSKRTGKQPKTLVGRQCYEALYHRGEPCPGCRVNETRFSGQNTSRTERRWGIEEDPTEWEINTYPIHDETEQIVSAILLEQDVTERRRLEGILAQSEKLAAVGQLAAGVAHEINNPLTAIIANAQILQRELPQDDDVQESIDLIVRAGARATQVVRNLLDFARKEQYRLEPTDVNETIQRALALVQHELLARSIQLEFEPAKDLPRILASQDHLQGVWLNLLLNAIDAMDGNAEGKLRVTTRRTGGEVRISFMDNGKGIPPERISRIFEPFYTTKAPGRGTGLGLSVCHRIIKQHGGHILVDSQLGSGTEFTIDLPIT